MRGRQEFNDDHVDAAIDYVIANGAEDRAGRINYTRVFDAAGMAAPQVLHHGGESHVVTQFMERFHFRCKERGLPPLDSLIVHVAGGREGRPGAGYFRVNGLDDPFAERTRPEIAVAAVRFWEVEMNECRDWGQRSRRGRL